MISLLRRAKILCTMATIVMLLFQRSAIIAQTRSDSIRTFTVASCLTDFDSLVSLVTTNYAGFPDKVREIGQATMQESISNTRKLIVDAPSEDSCNYLMFNWLNQFKDRHLGLAGVWPQWAGSRPLPLERVPKKLGARSLSDSTFLLTVPSFELSFKSQLDSLLRRYDESIRSRPTLIIDVRWNNGGGDATFKGLIPYLYASPIKQAGAEVLCSGDNLKAWERVKTYIPKNEKATLDQIDSLMALMRRHMGHFATFVDDSMLTLPAVMPQPRTIAILINERCASSCEEFLLAAQQSNKVRLFGRPSAGTLDYSNVLDFQLPSGNRTVLLPCTRSKRLLQHGINGKGIQPDVLIGLALNQDSGTDQEINYVLQYLEQHK